MDFYQSVFLGLGENDSVCTSIAQDLDFISSDEGVEECGRYFSSRKATLSHYASCTELDLTEDESEGGAGAGQPQRPLVSRHHHAVWPQQRRHSTTAPYSVPVANGLNVWKNNVKSELGWF